MKTHHLPRRDPTWVSAISAFTWALACSTAYAIDGANEPATLGRTPAMPGTYLFNARVESKQDGSQLCNGARINNDWVLTAAHCVEQGIWSGNIQVRTGATDLNVAAQSGNIWGVSNIHIHPRYHRTAEADVALLQLNPNQVTCPNGQCQPAPTNEGLTIGVPPRNEFARALAQSSPTGTENTCLQGEKTEGIRLGWGNLSDKEEKSAAAQLMISPMQILNDCAAPQPPAVPEDVIWANSVAGSCPSDNGGALVAFTKAEGQPFLVGIAGLGSETCDPSQAYTAFSDVTSEDLRQWIITTAGAVQNVGDNKDNAAPANTSKPPKAAQQVQPQPSNAQAALAPLPSPEQVAVRNAAWFRHPYSTNVQLTIPAGLTTPSHPLRISVAWDGQNKPFDMEQVYDGTAPFAINHAYDPHGQINITANPQLRVTDPAVINPDGTPLSLGVNSVMGLFPVYDISLSPLRSDEIHRSTAVGRFLGTCDFLSAGEGTLSWTGIFGKAKIGTKHVDFPNSVLYDSGTTPRWSADDVQAFAVKYHYDTARSQAPHFPIITFDEEEAHSPFTFGPNDACWLGFCGFFPPHSISYYDLFQSTPDNADSPYTFTGDNGTSTRTFSDIIYPIDTGDKACRVRVEYEATVTLDLIPGDDPVVTPPPPPVVTPPPTNSGGGGQPSGPGTGRPPRQEQ